MFAARRDLSCSKVRRLLAIGLVLGCAHADPSRALVTVTGYPSGDKFVLWDDGQVDVTTQRTNRSFQLRKDEFENARRTLLAQELFRIRPGPTRDDGGLYFQLRDGTNTHAFRVGMTCHSPEALMRACHLIEALERQPRAR